MSIAAASRYLAVYNRDRGRTVFAVMVVFGPSNDKQRGFSNQLLEIESSTGLWILSIQVRSEKIHSGEAVALCDTPF